MEFIILEKLISELQLKFANYKNRKYKQFEEALKAPDSSVPSGEMIAELFGRKLGLGLFDPVD